VLMALGDHSELRKRTSGVACLATPFITARDRNVGRDAWAILGKGTSLALVFLFGSFVQSLFAWFTLGPNANSLFGSKYFLWNSVCLPVLGLVVILALLLRNRISEHASKLRHELTPRPLDESSQLLIIRSPADEASGAIGIFQFLSQATVRLFLFGESCYLNAVAVVRLSARKHLRIGIYWFAAFLAFIAAFFALGYFSNWPGFIFLMVPIAAGYMISGLVSFFALVLALYDGLEKLSPRLFSWPKQLIVTYFASVLATMTWLLIPVLSMLLVLPFGWQVALANLLLNVTVESTPIGSWEIHLIEPPTVVML
jgi:hypothetical protein